MSGGITEHYGLKKPDFNIRPWDQDINSNFDLIDSLLFTLFQIPNIAGVWRNSTSYTAKQNVLDPDSLVFYQCLADNVSPATGSFAADRIARPSNWSLSQSQLGSIRYDQDQTISYTQMLQALKNIGLSTNRFTITTAVPNVRLMLPDNYPAFEIIGTGIVLTNPGASLLWRVSDDGVNFKDGARDYTFDAVVNSQSTTISGVTFTANAGQMAFNINSAGPVAALSFRAMFNPGAAGAGQSMLHDVAFRSNAPAWSLATYSSIVANSGAARAKAITFFSDTGQLSAGTFVARGIA